jgi:ribosomal protein S18 acetylase RimI-like enzyme
VEALPIVVFRSLCPDLQQEVVLFFESILATGADRTFHPHPFTAAEADLRCHYSGKDIYCALLEDGRMRGYGLLRGWDEGFDVPSLGIAIASTCQGRGYGRKLMLHLHDLARAKGAKRIRLSVYTENKKAIALYRSLGYRFGDESNEKLVAYYDVDD